MEKLLAVDVAILPSQEVMTQLIGLIEYNSDSVIRLDTNKCWPHVTLAMGVISQTEIPQFLMAIRAFDSEAKTIEIEGDETRTYTISNGKRLSEVSIKVTPEFSSLRTRVVEGIRPLFLDNPATPEMFSSPPKVDPITTTWVLKYGETFRPHVTLGEGDVKALEPLFKFRPAKLALCQLGNYCTCRQVLI